MPDSESVPSQPLMEACTHCGMLIDVSEQSPFEKVHCPSCGGALRVRRDFNHYELLEVVGVGGMGTVYKALDKNLLRNVALKILKKEFGEDADTIGELEREARITASISHPHVVKVFSFGQAHGQYYLAMELVERGSLDDLMQIQNRVAEIQALSIGIQIAQGLSAAHAKGLVHSDVKPGNILFADAQTAKIVDFGLAILQEQQAEEKGEIWGTPYYVPPERLNKQPEDFRSDMYSLGGTLFHALAGRPPFEAETASLVALKHIKSKAVSLQAFAPEVSSETAYVINRMLQKEMADRYDSYQELVEHLTYARDKLQQSLAGGRKQKERLQLENEKSKVLGGILSLVMLVAILAAGWYFYHYIKEQEEESRRPAPAAAGEATRAGASEAARVMETARRQMVDRSYRKALRTMQELVEGGVDGQPAENWAQLHLATAAMLAGKQDVAAGVFNRLHSSDLYSRDPAELQLANFFLEAGRLMRDNEVMRSSIVSMYSPDNFEAYLLFLFGLKNWRLDEFEDAHALFRAFLDANPDAPYEWIAEFKPVAERFVEDAELARDLRRKAEEADTPGEMKQVLEEVGQAKQNLHDTDGLRSVLLALQARLERRIENPNRVVVRPDPTPTPTPTPAPTPTPTPTPTPEPTVPIAKVREELQAVEELTGQYRAALESGQFVEAAAAIARFSPESTEAARALDTLPERAEWLGEFRNQLIADINRHGYAKPVPRRNGATLPGEVSSANADGIEVKIQYGTMPIPWREIRPATQLEMARAFFGKSGEEGGEAARKWLAGVFAYESGMKDAAGELMTSAGQMESKYKDRLGIFFQ